jgi:hypothetical protein
MLAIKESPKWDHFMIKFFFQHLFGEQSIDSHMKSAHDHDNPMQYPKFVSIFA